MSLHTSGPWQLGNGYHICKGSRVIMECDGSTTIEERQSICDSLNRDYLNDGDLLAACEMLPQEAKNHPNEPDSPGERAARAGDTGPSGLLSFLTGAIAKTKGK